MHSTCSHSRYAMVSSCGKQREGRMALDLFYKMMHQQRNDVKPRVSLFLAMLKACGIAEEHREGRILHSQVVEGGMNADLMTGNTLINMYAKCGLLVDSQRVFDLMSNRDVISWNVLISGYAQYGHVHIPLQLFQLMQRDGIKPCKVTYSSILKACKNTGITINLRILHQQIIKDSMESDTMIGNTLLDMYAKRGMLEEAQKVFDDLKNRTIVSWGAIIAGYASQGHIVRVLSLFSKMVQSDINPNPVMFSVVLKSCGGEAAREYGMFIHDLIIRSNLHTDLITGNTLIDMYVRCGSIEDAFRAFIGMSKHDAVSWNTMISGYVNEGYYVDAVRLFERMQQTGVHLEKALALSIIKACTRLPWSKLSTLLYKERIEMNVNLSDSIPC